jgi:hypothetical protein
MAPSRPTTFPPRQKSPEIDTQHLYPYLAITA